MAYACSCNSDRPVGSLHLDVTECRSWSPFPVRARLIGLHGTDGLYCGFRSGLLLDRSRHGDLYNLWKLYAGEFFRVLISDDHGIRRFFFRDYRRYRDLPGSIFIWRRSEGRPGARLYHAAANISPNARRIFRRRHIFPIAIRSSIFIDDGALGGPCRTRRAKIGMP